MAKLDYDEQFKETEEEIRARDAKERKVTPDKESGRSVFESQRLLREKSQNLESHVDEKVSYRQFRGGFWSFVRL